MCVVVDGVACTLPSGCRVKPNPGESICLPSRTIYQFREEEGKNEKKTHFCLTYSNCNVYNKTRGLEEKTDVETETELQEAG